MQILKMHNLTQNYRINLAARGILQSHGTLRHMTDESNNGIHGSDIGGDTLTRCKKAVLGITLRLAGCQTCTITHRRTAEAH